MDVWVAIGTAGERPRGERVRAMHADRWRPGGSETCCNFLLSWHSAMDEGHLGRAWQTSRARGRSTWSHSWTESALKQPAPSRFESPPVGAASIEDDYAATTHSADHEHRERATANGRGRSEPAPAPAASVQAAATKEAGHPARPPGGICAGERSRISGESVGPRTRRRFRNDIGFAGRRFGRAPKGFRPRRPANPISFPEFRNFQEFPETRTRAGDNETRSVAPNLIQCVRFR